MKTARILCSVIGMALGAWLFIYGGADDSPGAQLLGALVALGCATYAIRQWRK